jgi:hypothetical protein
MIAFPFFRIMPRTRLPDNVPPATLRIGAYTTGCTAPFELEQESSR